VVFSLANDPFAHLKMAEFARIYQKPPKSVTHPALIG
jgi:hypothetical protein